jgi:hypothetical protein
MTMNFNLTPCEFNPQATMKHAMKELAQPKRAKTRQERVQCMEKVNQGGQEQ